MNWSLWVNKSKKGTREMTKEELIDMARQSGWEYAHDESGFEPLWTFAKLVAEKEREACANICDGYSGYKTAFCALKIRARGKNE